MSFESKSNTALVNDAADRFDEQGNLKDTATRDLIRKLLRNLTDWTRRIQQTF